jgi:acyl-CoA reductase-like NAD-dependent aldehyde dehydrogenase
MTLFAETLIDGLWQPAQCGGFAPSIDPSDQSEIGHYSASGTVARAPRNGSVWIDDHNKLFAEAETGSYRRSGLGRLHGYDGLIDFLEVKPVFQNCGTVQAMDVARVGRLH